MSNYLDRGSNDKAEPSVKQSKNFSEVNQVEQTEGGEAYSSDHDQKDEVYVSRQMHTEEESK